ncbi:rod shape-determining protein MreD [Parasedimentitalea psychrophila]|uniref:Rod shape-determining protein MreD n=1 Tax=Parasedimentitalea psychrophila TaxID=2997337 RepID=A0A9Y2L1T8_9RHOB|nr:rod shape-determining protein MreD [Parasedimentitalea psychrophila]WIY26410.1 rod shape-determining protein MreD [Parasedimentitalea psychrophila]
MANTSPAHVWIMRAAFPALALLIMFFHLLPLDTVPRKWAPPDLLVASALAWSLRRPDYLPTVLLAVTLLLADLMFQRPPGLLALLVLLACEYLKPRALSHRDTGFAAEWLSVSLVLTAITVLNRMALALVGVQQAPFGLILIQMILTIAAYPLVVLVSQSILGVRRMSSTELETLGIRL